MMRSKKKQRRLRVAIVGAGKVGLVLGRILADRGDRIVCVVSRTEASARRGARFLRCRRQSTSLDALPPDVDVVMITTPHAAVEHVARALSACRLPDFRRIAVCHASGMLTAAALEPLRERGATVFSFHPLQTFPRDFEPREILPSACGIFYGVDGDPKAIRRARDLARRLRGKIIEIPPEMRALYHASCVVASNHLATLLSVLERMYLTISGGRGFYPVFRPIIEATLRNIAGSSPAIALSGPVARGGVETVSGHLEALKMFTPELIPYFAAVSRETVKLALAKGSIDGTRAEELGALFSRYTEAHLPAREMS